jgi:hypothetical protein
MAASHHAFAWLPCVSIAGDDIRSVVTGAELGSQGI